MLRTQIYLPDEMHRELVFLAKKNDFSMAELTRQFVKVGIKTKGKRRKKNSGNFLLKLANQAVGGLAKDLSSKHDEYLYGKKSSFGK